MGKLIDTFIERRLEAMPDEFLTSLIMDEAGIEPCDDTGFRYWKDEAHIEPISDEYRHRGIQTNPYEVYDWAEDETFGVDR